MTSADFTSHSKSTLRAWAKRLRLFRFVAAVGGHAHDGDALVVAYRYHSEEELFAFFSRLGITLIRHASPPPQPQVGVRYSGEEFARFPSLIRGSEWLEQPGHCVIAGEPAFAWCAGQEIRISLSDGYAVTEARVASAEAIEKVLAEVTLERIDPPVDAPRCLCPKYHPAWFR